LILTTFHSVLEEVQCVNESDTWLKEFSHELGLRLRSNATYEHIRRDRFGRFSIEHALLAKHWTLSSILANVGHCARVLDDSKLHRQTISTMDDEQNELGDYLESYPTVCEVLCAGGDDVIGRRLGAGAITSIDSFVTKLRAKEENVWRLYANEREEDERESEDEDEDYFKKCARENDKRERRRR